MTKNWESAYKGLASNETNSVNNDDETPETSKWESILWLAVLTICISVLSEYLVNATGGTSGAMNIPITLVSVILLPIVCWKCCRACQCDHFLP